MSGVTSCGGHTALCASMRGDLGLLLSLLLCVTATCDSMSPPGKPVMLDCISPEKETFTCWWEPGSDGGLPTTHRLLYTKDRFSDVYECPDYRSAGRNSCFFDKAHTSIWVDYSLWVVAANALGNITSDLVKTDVMDIVKPNAPDNVTLVLEQRDDSQCLHVRWEPPHNIDTKSGWATIKYELRIKEEDRNLWKDYASGTQANFVVYNISPGVTYAAQVRCRLDHSSWSEWSNVTYVKVPNYFQKEKPFWVIVSIVTVVSFMTPVCLLITKRKSVRRFLLPSVPAPKIKGLDVKLLKCGRSEDIANALIVSQPFPPAVALEDQVEEYILVSDSGDGRLPDTRRSLVIPAGTHLDLNVSENNAEVYNFIKSAESLPEDVVSDVGVRRDLCPGTILANADRNCPSSAKYGSAAGSVVRPLADGCYVDVQRRDATRGVQAEYSRVEEVGGGRILLVERGDAPGYADVQKQDESIPLGYSRVKEVHGDAAVVLETQSPSAASSLGHEGTKLLPRPARAGVCTELGSDYVVSVPAPPSMMNADSTWE